MCFLPTSRSTDSRTSHGHAHENRQVELDGQLGGGVYFIRAYLQGASFKTRLGGV